MTSNQKHAVRLAFLALAIAGFAASAQAAEPANYVGIHGGVNNLNGWDAAVTLGPGVSLPGRLTLNHGGHFSVILGRQTENARFVKVVHNGQLLHENEEVTCPTCAAAFDDERATGPLKLQGDHGPVAFRNLRIWPLRLP